MPISNPIAEITPYVQAYGYSGQFIPSTTNTPIQFVSPAYDNLGHWNSANPTRVTCKRKGMYLIGGKLRFASTSTAQHTLIIRENGSGELYRDTKFGGTGSSGVQLGGAVLVALSPNSYLELIAFQSSGSSVDASPSGFQPVLWLSFVTDLP